LQTQEPLAPGELGDTLVCETQAPLAKEQLAARLRGVFDRLAAAPEADG
jgi:hypothetical protein